MNPQGFQIWTSNLGIKDDTADFALIVSDRPATACGLYTRSRFAGPSVTLSRAVTADGHARGVVVISKNANVANGAQGDADAAELQALTAAAGGIEPGEVVVASTGVIGRPYPMDVIRRELPEAVSDAASGSFDDAARAIMTTDTRPKVARRSVGAASVVGIAKGVGMIEPNMATMLAFLFTDAEVGRTELEQCFRRVVDTTFNALSIDTDTSTSDTAVILANGVAGPVDAGSFETALREVATELVLALASDGEGASKVIEVVAEGARDHDQARRVAKSVVNSPLVKTAVHGSDPNWGRIAMAVGKCEDDLDIDPEQVTISIGGVEMYPGPADDAALGSAETHMRGSHVEIGVRLGSGDARFTAYGCDLTDGYIRINADYTT